jgi:hypothetical protein
MTDLIRLIDPLERAHLLRTEADLVLQMVRLQDILARYAERVAYTGSYLLDVMAYPDIDVMISALPVRHIFQIGAELAACPPVTQVIFEKSSDPDLPDGLYLKPRIAWGNWGRPWKIDIWSLSDEVFDRKQADMQRFQSRITPPLRELILQYKASIMTSQNRTPMYSGYWIYRATLEEGLTDFQQLTAYLIAHGIRME